MASLKGSLFAVVTALAAIGVGACGGPSEAKSPSGAASGGGSSDYRASDDRPVAAPSECEDGTCMECGDGICPAGYFCDESEAVAVCSWLPACADAATCECVAASLGSGCDCETRDGGIYVTCR